MRNEGNIVPRKDLPSPRSTVLEHETMSLEQKAEGVL